MAKVTRADGEPPSRSEAVAALVALGMDAQYAAFVLAMDAGEVQGDVVVILSEGDDDPTDIDRAGTEGN